MHVMQIVAAVHAYKTLELDTDPQKTVPRQDLTVPSSVYFVVVDR